MRAYKIAMTPPMMPVALVAGHELQEDAVPDGAPLSIPKLTMASPPAGDSGAVAEVARLLVAAENPVLVTDRVARTPAGLAGLIELAETLQAPVVDRNGRMNFPTRHPLNQTERARRGHRARRRDRRSRTNRFLEHREFRARTGQSSGASGDQARREADQHHRQRSVS